MTERELEQQLRALYNGRAYAPASVPSELYTNVLAIPDRLPAPVGVTGSRRTMLLLAAAMLVALVVGSAIAIGAGLIPWLEDERPTELVVPIDWGSQPLSDIPAGRYYVDVASSGGLPPSSTMRVSFTLPEGWERVPVESFLWGQDRWIGFGVVEGIYVDPCRPHLGTRDLPGGWTADDIAENLGTVPGFDFISATATTVAGYPGVLVDLIAPADSSDCVGGESRLLRLYGLYNYLPSVRDHERMRIYLLQVEGRPFVIRAGSELEVVEASRVELQTIIDSVEIDPPTAR